MFIRKNKIKYNNNWYNIKVDTYTNGRMHIYLTNNKESLDITIDVPDLCIKDGSIFLEPSIMSSGILKAIKKIRLINKVIGMINYNYVDIPVAIINIGKLREFDSFGVAKHLDTVSSMRGGHYEE